jgi:hypothetical protein
MLKLWGGGAGDPKLILKVGFNSSVAAKSSFLFIFLLQSRSQRKNKKNKKKSNV